MKRSWVRAIRFFATGGFLLIFSVACASQNLARQQADAQRSQEKELVSRRIIYHATISPARHQVKTTPERCESLGGYYVANQDTPLVDCLLPATLKALKLSGQTPLAYPLAHPRILASVYDYFDRAGAEELGYGLYSYIVLPFHSSRAERFLEELFQTTGYAIDNLIDLEHLNVIYLPIRADQLSSLRELLSGGAPPAVNLFATQFYNYALAQKLLAQICAAPAEVIRDLCMSDLSGGPYLFTYARPASALSPVPPPYLFVDLSHVHIRAFGEFIAAYKAQVKRSDYPDHKRLDTLRLRLLNIVLTAADWIAPTKSAIADILHMAKGEGSP